MRTGTLLSYLVCLLFLGPVNAGAMDFAVAQSEASQTLNVADDEAGDLFSEDDAVDLEKFDREPNQPVDELGALGAPRVQIDVNKRTQRMTVYVGGQVKYSGWKVSTGKAGSDTRAGTFTPFEMNKNYVSKSWSRKLGKKIILPYGIKFDGGNLIHAASAAGTAKLGTRASHGCVRLAISNARTLYSLVSSVGMRNVRVRVF